jgi:hypothetical protein
MISGLQVPRRQMPKAKLHLIAGDILRELAFGNATAVLAA